MQGIARATVCIWLGEVTDNNDGSLEWCRPVPDEGADVLASQFPEFTLRREPAHQEAFIKPSPRGETNTVQW